MALPDWFKARLADGTNKLIKAINAYTGNAEELVATDANGLIAEDLLPTSIQQPQYSVVASEELAAYELINVFNDTGTTKIRLADAASGYRCDGYVTESVSNGVTTTIKFGGVVTASGLTRGAPVFLSATSGAATTTHPTLSTGDISQQVGIALSATEFIMEIQEPYFVV
jgi:hypothetical protein